MFQTMFQNTIQGLKYQFIVILNNLNLWHDLEHLIE